MGIAENLDIIMKNISSAAKKSGRTSSDITLVAVTKHVSIEKISEVVNLGVKHIGENRPLDSKKKFNGVKLAGVTKHMIGHLQSNKAQAAVKNFDVIQSVDSVKIAKEIDRQARYLNKKISVFIEVNISREERKKGIAPEEIDTLFEQIKDMPHIKIEGLMCMAPLLTPEETRPYFKQMKELFDSLSKKYPEMKYLSMGMSNDYVVAIEEGANMVRIGTAIFGA